MRTKAQNEHSMIDYVELVEIIEKWLREYNSANRAIMVGITGFPYCGKTSICLSLVDRQPELFAHVPMEAYILDRKERAAARLDGCACDAHSLNKSKEDIQSLTAGVDITLNEYSWESGGHTKRKKFVGSNKTFYLFDGSAISCPRVASLVERFFFFFPRKIDEWLELACLRDARERNWSMEDAIDLNRRKLATCMEQYRYLTQCENLSARVTIIPFEAYIRNGEQNFAYKLESNT